MLFITYSFYVLSFLFFLSGHTINGQKLLEFTWSQDMASAELNVKSASLWVRLEPRPIGGRYYPRKIPQNLNFTFWVFHVITSGLANATYLSGKVCYKPTFVS